MRFRFTLPPASACFRTAGKTHTPETCTFMFPGCGCFMAYIRFKMYGQIYGPHGAVIWCLILVRPRNCINASAMLPRCFRFTHQQLSRIQLPISAPTTFTVTCPIKHHKKATILYHCFRLTLPPASAFFRNASKTTIQQMLPQNIPRVFCKLSYTLA